MRNTQGFFISRAWDDTVYYAGEYFVLYAAPEGSDTCSMSWLIIY